MLEDTLSQNYRIRHLLQRVCTSVREYDSLQFGLSTLVGIPYEKIPPEVLDAFLHDPSAVTGHTRRARGWLAVEDIHLRIQRQQDTLQLFMHSLDHGMATPSHKILGDPVANLMDALGALSARREDLTHRAEEATTVLKRVKAIQSDVKRDYNDTLSHTSLVYPEVRVHH